MSEENVRLNSKLTSLCHLLVISKANAGAREGIFGGGQGGDSALAGVRAAAVDSVQQKRASSRWW